jgi:hypothetical protein
LSELSDDGEPTRQLQFSRNSLPLLPSAAAMIVHPPHQRIRMMMMDLKLKAMFGFEIESHVWF